MSKSPTVVELCAGQVDRNGGTHCPNPQASMQAWNTHPRVFIDLSRSGRGQCPYCGTAYVLRDFVQTWHNRGLAEEGCPSG